MWKLLVVLFRLPLAVGWFFLLTTILIPLGIAFALLLFLWGLITLPFMIAGEVIANRPEGVRSYVKEVFDLPGSVLGGIGNMYQNLWHWATARQDKL